MFDYGRTATFAEGGGLAVVFGVSLGVRYAFEDDCLAALHPQAANPEQACAASGNPPRLTCEYETELCTCTFPGERQSEGHEIGYSLGEEEGRMTVQGRAAAVYCIDDDQLVIDFAPFGPQGWGAWLLYR